MWLGWNIVEFLWWLLHLTTINNTLFLFLLKRMGTVLYFAFHFANLLYFLIIKHFLKDKLIYCAYAQLLQWINITLSISYHTSCSLLFHFLSSLQYISVLCPHHHQFLEQIQTGWQAQTGIKTETQDYITWSKEDIRSFSFKLFLSNVAVSGEKLSQKW